MGFFKFPKGLLIFILDILSHHTHILNLCLNDSSEWIQDSQIREYVQLALKKAINLQSDTLAPPLFSLLMAKDLSYSLEKAAPLICACVYFYTAADLTDDIQDKDPKQAVLQATSPAQAMNIANLLLMGAYRCLNKLSLPSDIYQQLSQLLTQTGIRMSTGQFWDIQSTNQTTPTQTPLRIAEYKAGAEIACFVACIPQALGLDPSLYYTLGEKLGILLQVMSDYFDIWILPHAQALSEDLSVLKNTLPLSAALQDTQWASDVSLAFAGNNTDPDKQFALRRLLVQTQAIEKFEIFLQDSQQEFRQIFKQLPELSQMQSLTNNYITKAQELLTGLKKLKSITQKKVSIPRVEASTIKQMAIDYLCFIPDFKDAWEVQRWGFLGKSTLYGDIFNPLLILEALNTCALDIEAPFKTVLHKRSEYGWHYYSNSLEIPPDADDLAQILQLSTVLSDAERKTWIEPVLPRLLNNLNNASGACPTWLGDESTYPTQEIQQAWYGNTCFAVMANLYYGLACYDANTYAHPIEAGVQYLIQNYDAVSGQWPSQYYCSPLYTLYLVGRLFQKQAISFDFTPSLQLLLTQQKGNGSWSDSPQETAFALLFLGTQLKTSELKIAQHKGALYVMEQQLYDGSWPAEDLFIRPGKKAKYEYFQHAKVTSAFCLRAIHSVF